MSTAVREKKPVDRKPAVLFDRVLTSDDKEYFQTFKRQTKGAVKFIAITADADAVKDIKDREIDHLFIFTNASDLPKISRLVDFAMKSNIVRIIFVRKDIESPFEPQMLDKITSRALRKFFFLNPDDTRTPDLIIDAWDKGTQSSFIAAAMVSPSGNLSVVDYGMERYCLNLYETFKKTFSKVSSEQLNEFEVTGPGLHWPRFDIDIDLDNIKYACDPKYRTRANAEKLKHNQKFGHAVKLLRQSHGLNQSDIEGVSERTMRSIEKGDAHPNVSTLRKLAEAHSLSFEEYFQELGKYLPAKAHR